MFQFPRLLPLELGPRNYFCPGRSENSLKGKYMNERIRRHYLEFEITTPRDEATALKIEEECSSFVKSFGAVEVVFEVTPEFKWCPWALKAYFQHSEDTTELWNQTSMKSGHPYLRLMLSATED